MQCNYDAIIQYVWNNAIILNALKIVLPCFRFKNHQKLKKNKFTKNRYILASLPVVVGIVDILCGSLFGINYYATLSAHNTFLEGRIVNHLDGEM